MIGVIGMRDLFWKTFFSYTFCQNKKHLPLWAVLAAWQAGWAQASPRELPRNSSTACLEDFSMADVATLQKAVEKYEKFWPRHLIGHENWGLRISRGWLKSVGEEDDMYTFTYQNQKIIRNTNNIYTCIYVNCKYLRQTIPMLCFLSTYDSSMIISKPTGVPPLSDASSGFEYGVWWWSRNNRVAWNLASQIWGSSIPLLYWSGLPNSNVDFGLSEAGFLGSLTFGCFRVSQRSTRKNYDAFWCAWLRKGHARP